MRQCDQSDQTREVVRRYWRSWQTLKREDMEATVADDYVLYVHGDLSPIGKRELIFNSFDRAVPWEGVRMISEVYLPREAAIYYTGVNSQTKETMFVTEFLKLNDRKKIVANHTVIHQQPPEPGGGRRPYLYLELWRAKPSWWQLPVGERRRLITQITPQGIPGADIVASMVNEASKWRVPYDYFSVWEIDSSETVRRVEERIADLGWWRKYWEEVHAWGRRGAPGEADPIPDHMIFGRRAPEDHGSAAVRAPLSGGLATLCDVPFRLPFEVLKVAISALDALLGGGGRR